ncbi:hypothetical protein [Kineosporia sp. NBRC 101731]|uniref:hypothetical protein n=1 Tax=Kineosporia sp. NBRC 101731 TaxID=3032199 RepID=UPI0024A294FE|nr:hypothetical protein [Kineosporia sp. NBRC 101731]GLY28540.1 hypothetical protein Kisp02_19050 [Kineosporia sp. NBRC 101731]
MTEQQTTTSGSRPDASQQERRPPAADPTPRTPRTPTSHPMAYPPQQQPPMQWTGRLEFDLTDSRGWRVGTIEVVVRMDTVTLWRGNRTLAVMHRESFKHWLVRPVKPFEFDDVVWFMQGTTTCLTIDGANSYAVPEPIVDHLFAVA